MATITPKEKSSQAVKLSRQLASIPIEKYRMQKDGRKWKAAATNRMMLADFLGTFGDGDGSRIFPSIATMTEKFGWSRRKTCYLLEDLRQLKLLEDTPHYSPSKHHRTRIRRMNVNVFLLQECKIESGLQDSGVQDSTVGVQDTAPGVQPYVAHNRHSDRHLTDTRTPLPPINGGLEKFCSWRGEIIAVQMGRRRRLPNLDSHIGASTQDLCAFLARKGFPVRIVSEISIVPDSIQPLDPDPRFIKGHLPGQATQGQHIARLLRNARVCGLNADDLARIFGKKFTEPN